MNSPHSFQTSSGWFRSNPFSVAPVSGVLYASCTCDNSSVFFRLRLLCLLGFAALRPVINLAQSFAISEIVCKLAPQKLKSLIKT